MSLTCWETPSLQLPNMEGCNGPMCALHVLLHPPPPVSIEHPLDRKQLFLPCSWFVWQCSFLLSLPSLSISGRPDDAVLEGGFDRRPLLHILSSPPIQRPPRGGCGVPHQPFPIAKTGLNVCIFNENLLILFVFMWCLHLISVDFTFSFIEIYWFCPIGNKDHTPCISRKGIRQSGFW